METDSKLSSQQHQLFKSNDAREERKIKQL